ncbi:transposase [Streptomyces sp. NPDC046978]|uniref:transposase n=1 Tax=Streptomyces sp. NPDC046978 TaxID=3154704 RepID=UPI0033C93541
MLEPLLPRGKKPGRPPIRTRRQLIDGIRFPIRTGIPWRDIPAEYGPWGRAYNLFPPLAAQLHLAAPLHRPQDRADAKDLITWDLNIDSTVRRAHQHAAGARERGVCRRSCPAVSPPSPTITASGARAGPDHQAAPRRRGGAEAHVHRDHRRAARGLPAVRGRPGPHQCAPAGVR